MDKSIFLSVLAGVLALSSGVSPVLAQSPRPPGDVRAVDFPNDAGEAVLVEWELSPDDQPQPAERLVAAYEILRREAGQEAFARIGEETYQTRSFKDDRSTRGASYFYQVVAVGPDGARSSAAATDATGDAGDAVFRLLPILVRRGFADRGGQRHLLHPACP